MYHIAFPVLYLIALFWLVKKRKQTMGHRLELLVEISVIAGFIILVITSVANLQQFLDENTSNGIVAITLFILLLVVISALTIFGTISIIAAFDYLFAKLATKNFSANIMPESIIKLGGTIFIQSEFSGVLKHGYLIAHISSPFNETKPITSHYDDTKKLGTINTGKFDIKWKWNIPENYFDGEYEIRVELWDVINWAKIRKIPFIVKTQDLTIDVSRKTEEKIAIQKIILPPIKSISKFDSKLQSGWICIKIYNSIEQKINCCFGFISTNEGQFPIYDYKSYLRDKKENDLDLYLSFSLEPNSTKLLYSEIKGDKNHIKIIIDVGKEEITKELSLDINSFSDTHFE